MKRIMLKSKIHRAKVTGANIQYEGSITIDQELIEAAKLLKYEQVDVYNINNGQRFSTYVMKGVRGKGEIRLNGAAARLVSVGDLIIICSYALFDEKEAIHHKPTFIYINEKNRIKKKKTRL